MRDPLSVSKLALSARAFLAIELPAQAQNEIAAALTSLKKEYPAITWVPPHNYHLTLHFFGEQPAAKIETIKSKMDELLYDIRPFHLYALEGGIFLHDKILLYLEFARQKSLEEVEERIRHTFGPEKSRKFVPHITLARYRVPAKQQYLLLKKKVQRLAIDTSFKIDTIYLYESILTGKIPQYRRLAAFALNP